MSLCCHIFLNFRLYVYNRSIILVIKSVSNITYFPVKSFFITWNGRLYSHIWFFCPVYIALRNLSFSRSGMNMYKVIIFVVIVLLFFFIYMFQKWISHVSIRPIGRLFFCWQSRCIDKKIQNDDRNRDSW